MSRPVYLQNPSLEALDTMYRQGKLPLSLAGAMRLEEAAAIARSLPPVRGHDLDLPNGYGILPPQGAEPMVSVAKGVRDAYGRPVPPGARGIVGALWNHRGRCVLRLWFRSDHPDPQGRLLRGPVDVFEDAVSGVWALEGVVPQLTGWELVRLDHQPEVKPEGEEPTLLPLPHLWIPGDPT